MSDFHHHLTGRRLFLGLVLAVLGYGTLLVLYGRFDPTPRLGFTMDRRAAIARAHELAAEQGVVTTAWRGRAHVHSNREVWQLHEALYRQGGALPVHTALVWRVALDDPSSDSTASFEIDPAGRVVGMSLEPGSAATDDPSATPQAVAVGALERLSGLDVAEMAPVGTNEPGVEFAEFQWRSTELAEATVRANVTVRALRIARIQVTVEWDDGFRAAVLGAGSDGKPLRMVRATSLVIIFLASLFVLAGSVVRRALPLRSTLVLFGVALVVHLADLIVSMPPELAMVQLVGAFVFIPVSALGLAALWGGGFMAARRTEPQRILAFELLLRGRLTTQPIGAALATGILLGGVIAAIPSLCAAAGRLLGHHHLGFNPDDLFGAGSILLSRASALLWASYSVLLVFALVRPLLDDQLRPRRLAPVLAFVVGALIFTSRLERAPILLSILCGVLVYLAADWIHRHHGLLAVVTACVAAPTAISVLALVSQPAPSLRGAGIVISVLCLLVLVGAVIVGLRGAEVGLKVLPPAVGRPRAERERIKAELQVAHDAQMRMLPVAPPQIPGFGIAAACVPARDVGGDLYDFAEVASGGLGLGVGNVGWGLCVGDVSGKGMAAALYMTLARGLLGAALEDRIDPVEILCDVNRDFFELTPKNVFITMLFGTLDPPTHRLRFVRAGHTPLVWRRVARGETLFLTPPGLAVGMVAPTTFDAALEAQEIQLEPGDGLFIASDGLAEARNWQRQEYGDERFKWVVETTDGLDAAAARDAIIADLETFTKNAPAHDDVTLIVLRVDQEGVRL